MDREYWVVKVNRLGQPIEDIRGPFPTYREAWAFGETLAHDRWTVVRRK